MVKAHDLPESVESNPFELRHVFEQLLEVEVDSPRRVAVVVDHGSNSVSRHMPVPS